MCGVLRPGNIYLSLSIYKFEVLMGGKCPNRKIALTIGITIRREFLISAHLKAFLYSWMHFMVRQ